MDRNPIWILALFAIALTPGCSQLGKEQQGVDVTEQSQMISIVDQENDRQEKAPQQSNGEERSQATSSSDSQTEPQLNNDRQSSDTATQSSARNQGIDHKAGDQQAADAGEPNQSILTTGQNTEGQIENDLQSLDAAQSNQTPMADPNVDPQLGESLPSMDAEELHQTTSGGGQSATSQAENGQQPGVSTAQSQTAASIATQQTINPLWVTGPSPHDVVPNERSYLVASASATESAEVVPASGASNPFQEYSATQLLGSLQLFKIIRRFRTSVDYKGGANLSQYSNNRWAGKQIELMTASESVSWPKAQVTLVDTFRDFPGVPYSSGLGGSNVSDFLGGGSGPIRHFSNVALASVTYDLTPRSGLTVLGSYSSINYFGLSNLNNKGASVLAGYTYQLTPRTSVAASYGYQDWKFAGGQREAAQIGQFSYQHQISPRTSLTLGAGPEFITSRNLVELQLGPIQIPIVVTSHQTTFNVNAWLSYSIPKGTVGLLYEHSLTSGAGLFAGANTDSASVTLMRSILRSWTTSFAAGFTRLSSLENQASGSVGSIYQYGFASVALQRRFGQHLNFAASYQFNEESSFSGCSASSGCGNIVHTALFTITWHTLPIFLDRGKARQETVPIENPLMGNQDLLQAH